MIFLFVWHRLIDDLSDIIQDSICSHMTFAKQCIWCHAQDMCDFLFYYLKENTCCRRWWWREWFWMRKNMNRLGLGNKWCHGCFAAEPAVRVIMVLIFMLMLCAVPFSGCQWTGLWWISELSGSTETMRLLAGSHYSIGSILVCITSFHTSFPCSCFTDAGILQEKRGMFKTPRFCAHGGSCCFDWCFCGGWCSFHKMDLNCILLHFGAWFRLSNGSKAAWHCFCLMEKWYIKIL